MNDQTKQFINWLHPNGGAVNIFAKHATSTRTQGRVCPTDTAAIQYAVELDALEDTGAVWVNVHKPSAAARANVTRWQEEDMDAFQFFYVDVDSIRAAGRKNYAASETERQSAIDTATSIKNEVSGLPAPLHVDTGNGSSLLYPISLPKTEPNIRLMSELAAAIAQRFNDDDVEIDQAVLKTINRVTGIVGTMNRKKTEEPEEDRFHRPVQVIGEYPDRTPMTQNAFIAWALDFIGKNAIKSTTADNQRIETRQPDIQFINNQPTAAESKDEVIHRAARYLAQCEPAIEGQNGDNHTFKIAGHLLTFGLSPTEVHTLMMGEWNRTCSPPWDSDELMVKVESAYRNGTPRAAKDTGSLDLPGVTKVTAATDQTEAPEPLERQVKISIQRKLEAIASSVEVFKSQEGTAYATIEENGLLTNVEVNGGKFRHWLVRQFKAQEGYGPTSSGLDGAILSTAAEADVSPMTDVFVRLGWTDDAVYLDLSNDAHQVVEVTAAGWKIITRPPVKFIRPDGQHPLPTPARNGSLKTLNDFICQNNEDQFKLIVAYIVGSMMPKGPYPILTLNGEQGSGKTTMTRLLRRLVDPNARDAGRVPKQPDDLYIVAKHGWILTLDNLSGMSPTMADIYCGISTGQTASGRKLYSNGDDYLISICRPSILNGIPDLSKRGDVVTRMIQIPLEAMQRRRDLSEIEAAFTMAHPFLLGGLLDAVVDALANRGNVNIKIDHRLADFARWTYAAAQGGHLPFNGDEILGLLNVNAETAQASVIEGSIVGTALMKYLETNGKYDGYVGELHEEVRLLVDRSDLKSFPQTPNTFSDKLRGLKAAIKANGYQVEWFKRKSQGTPITITPIPAAAQTELKATDDDVFRKQAEEVRANNKAMEEYEDIFFKK